MRIRRHPIRAVIATAGALLLGGCASTAQTTAIGPPSMSTPSNANGMPPATSLQTSSAQGVATPSMAYATPPASPPIGSTTAPGSTPVCRTNTLVIVEPMADNPLRSACLHMGVDAQITLGAAGGWVWSPVQVSGPAVVAVTDDVGPGHTHHVTVRPLHPGTVTLTSASSFTPDPHGPATQMWSLTLTIAP
jgi:hypothetical protein